MKLTLLCVGRLKESYFRKAESEYHKRLSHYTRFDLVEVGDEAQLRKRLPDNAALILLDQRGKLFTSEEIAKDLIDNHQTYHSHRPLVFAIGGADGHSEALRTRADHMLCFGRATMGHRIVRLVLLEQLYRAFTILRGEPYHRSH